MSANPAAPWRILVINGPNLNLLGVREPEVYGRTTLEEIIETLHEQAGSRASVEHFQSNHEGALVERIHAAWREKIDFIIINPGAYTHTSIALRDALMGVSIPFIEVHLSNIHAREPFRHHSYLSDRAVGVIAGLGPFGYQTALEAALHWLDCQRNSLSNC